MQPIHLAIGVVEGLVTGALLVFLSQVEPGAVIGIRLSANADAAKAKTSRNPGTAARPVKVVAIVAVLALVCGSVLSWFASAYPDGLEWSMLKTAGVEELEASGSLHRSLGDLQQKTAFLPDYGFKASADAGDTAADAEPAWPAVDSGTTLSGIVGGVMTLAIAGLAGLLLYLPKRKKRLLAE